MTSPTSRTRASAVPDPAEQPSGVDPAAVAQQAFADPDALNRLHAITTLRDELEVVETAAVRDAVQQGATWSEIADLLGVTKQSAHRRFSVRINRAPATPPLPDLAPPTEPRIVVTAQARRAVRAARAAARALGHAEVDTSHLLLGLLADIAGPAARALEAIGVDFDGAREVVTANQPQTRAPAARQVPISATARDALKQSLREARRLNHAHLGVEHLLLGTVRDPEGSAVRALAELDVSPDDLERCLGKVLMEAPFEST